MRGILPIAALFALVPGSCTNGYDPFATRPAERQFRMFVSLTDPDILAERDGNAPPVAPSWHAHWWNVIHSMRAASYDPRSPYRADSQRCIDHVIRERRAAGLPELWPDK